MSVYGTNNGSMIDALRRDSRQRAIAIIDPDKITDGELDELHQIGFRGVRINLRTRSERLGASEWEEILMKYHHRLHRLDWVLQIFVSMDQIASVSPIMPKLQGMKVVFDHLGHPEAGRSPTEQTGCKELYDLLERYENIYIKLSGLYRLPDVPDLEKHILHLLKLAPNQVVWGSDWPHTAGPEYNPGGDPKAIQDFLKVDIPAFVQDCLRWCSYDEALIRKIWVDNPRRLWDYLVDD